MEFNADGMDDQFMVAAIVANGSSNSGNSFMRWKNLK